MSGQDSRNTPPAAPRSWRERHLAAKARSLQEDGLKLGRPMSTATPPVPETPPPDDDDWTAELTHPPHPRSS